MTYFQHGRRHTPEVGTDPILGGKNPWALYTGNGAVVSAPGPQTYISLGSFTSGPADQTAFGNALGSGGLSAYHGVSINEFGVYRMWLDYEFTSYTNGDVIEGSEAAELTGEYSNWVFGGDNDHANPVRVTLSATMSSLRFAHLYFIGGSLFDVQPGLPAVWVPWVQSAGGFHGFTANVTVMIEQLSRTYSTNVISGGSPRP